MRDCCRGGQFLLERVPAQRRCQGPTHRTKRPVSCDTCSSKTARHCAAGPRLGCADRPKPFSPRRRLRLFRRWRRHCRARVSRTHPTRPARWCRYILPTHRSHTAFQLLQNAIQGAPQKTLGTIRVAAVFVAVVVFHQIDDGFPRRADGRREPHLAPCRLRTASVSCRFDETWFDLKNRCRKFVAEVNVNRFAQFDESDFEIVSHIRSSL